MRCPLCGSPCLRGSWLGATVFQQQRFEYLMCADCQSLSCSPMPDPVALAAMYGPAYAGSFESDDGSDDSKEPKRIIDWLAKSAPGVFLDFGCGSGELLIAAQKIGWKPVGVEFDDAVARAVSKKNGVAVFTPGQVAALPQPLKADVVHLGDVIEHLTEPAATLEQVLQWLKPGGVVLAQGPLEANATLFTALMKFYRRLRANRPADMPPYHVLLATAQGQRRFFKRMGLEEIGFNLREVSWPAPIKLKAGDFGRPRMLGLFFARRCSQLVSLACPNRWGNRYFYAGRRMDPQPDPALRALVVAGAQRA